MNSEHNQSPEEQYKQNINTHNEEEGFNLAKEIIEMVFYFFTIVVVFILLQKFVGQHIEVNGKSMEDTLYNGDHLILEKVSYRFNDPERFDIVVFRPFDTEEETYFIKRIIALPGEKVQIKEGQVYINDTVLSDSYCSEKIMRAGIASQEIYLEEDEYFLLGDNRNNSTDSRSSEIGLVKRQAITGRAWARIWPLDSIEILDH